MINNMRDLGGIRTKDGRVLRQGMLVRSANLSEASSEDLKDVTTVIDLRTPKERDEAPDQCYNAQYLPIAIFESMVSGISHENESMTGRIPKMTWLYEQLILQCRETFRKVVLEIMEHDYRSGAVLWHCTEGKDRCGLTTALILEILGVDRETIMEDYLRTNRVNIPKADKIREQVAAFHGQEYADSVYQAYIADEDYLNAAWNAMEENSIGEYLEIDEQMIHDFREKILEDENRAIIFDLDGTLWDSSEQVSIIWNHVFERHPDIKVRLTKNDVTGFMGKTMEQIGEMLFPDKDMAFCTGIMDECAEEENIYLAEHGAVLFDGLRETIDTLKKDYSLYIVSNCQGGYIEAFQKAHGFVDDFDDIEMSGRTGKTKGENIRILMERNHIKKAVYVGDTAGDEEAARYAGIPFIYAAYGFGKPVSPDQTIYAVTELPDVISHMMA